MKREIKYLLEQWLRTKNNHPEVDQLSSSSGEESIPIQMGGKSNASVLTNFNPLIALDTYEGPMHVDQSLLVQ